MRKTALIAGWVLVGVGLLLIVIAIVDGLRHAENVATMQMAATIAVAGAVLVAGALVAGALAGGERRPARPQPTPPVQQQPYQQQQPQRPY